MDNGFSVFFWKLQKIQSLTRMQTEYLYSFSNQLPNAKSRACETLLIKHQAMTYAVVILNVH